MEDAHPHTLLLLARLHDLLVLQVGVEPLLLDDGPEGQGRGHVLEAGTQQGADGCRGLHQVVVGDLQAPGGVGTHKGCGEGGSQVMQPQRHA